MTTQEAHHRTCLAKTIGAGQAFDHPEGAHNFINNGTDRLVFYVAYFIPAGAAPTPIDAPGATRVLLAPSASQKHRRIRFEYIKLLRRFNIEHGCKYERARTSSCAVNFESSSLDV